VSPTIFLSGSMGAGKTTIARALSPDAIDLDASIEAREGKSVQALFASVGEAGFRRIEAAVALEVAAARPAVVALGGGTVTDPAVRRALLRAGTLITLRARPQTLAARLESDRSRPLLDAAGIDRAEILAQLIASRADAYAECHATIDTDDGDVASFVDRIRSIAARRPLAMPLGTRTYPIDVGRGLDAVVRERIEQLSPTSVVVVCDEATRAIADRLAPSAPRVVLPPGEAHKTIASVERIWDAALEARVDRRALVLAVGGGVVGDLAGFGAATLLRGIDFAQVPTTLLAMVDASVGGKTGFDRAQGKNLVGAIHQPRFVVADVDALVTLRDRELVSGLAEVVKSAWLEGEDDVAALEADVPLLRARDPDALERAIRRALRTKIAIVSEDEHERGARAHLNLGHTLGHAIEAASGWRETHGECIALGMIAALRIGIALGDATPADLDRATRLIAALGLGVDVDAALASPAIPALLAADKKRDAGAVRFVVPGAPGRIRLERLPIDRVLSLARAVT
jgi:shikimate kinase/3-dehydroquinate synthase